MLTTDEIDRLLDLRWTWQHLGEGEWRTATAHRRAAEFTRWRYTTGRLTEYPASAPSFGPAVPSSGAFWRRRPWSGG